MTGNVENMRNRNVQPRPVSLDKVKTTLKLNKNHHNDDEEDQVGDGGGNALFISQFVKANFVAEKGNFWPTPTTWDSDAISYLSDRLHIQRTTKRGPDDDGPINIYARGMGDYQIAENDLYREFDNPHFTFKERKTSAWGPVGEEETSVSGEYYISQLLIHEFLHPSSNGLRLDAAPDWKAVRDNSITINVPYLQLRPIMFSVMDVCNHNTLVVIPDDVWDDDISEGMYQSVTWVKLSDYLAIIQYSKYVVRDNLVKYFDTDAALRFMEAPQGELFAHMQDPDWVNIPGEPSHIDKLEERGKVEPSHHYRGQPRWWVESKWLADVEARMIPHNYRNIIFIGAAKLIAKEQLNPTAVFQYLAKLGRVNTKVAFVG